MLLNDLANRVRSSDKRMYAVGKIRGRIDTLYDLGIINSDDKYALDKHFAGGW